MQLADRAGDPMLLDVNDLLVIGTYAMCLPVLQDGGRTKTAGSLKVERGSLLKRQSLHGILLVTLILMSTTL